MDAAALIDQLTRHRTLGEAPREELAWLVAHGEVRHFEVGQIVSRATEPIESLYVVLSGRFSIHVDRGAGPKKVMEWSGGDVGGLLPYSRLRNPPGEALIQEATDVLMVHRTCFPDLIQRCPTITAALVHVMLDRARVFTSSDLHDEKMLSLGRLSAGLAHELNNPASAAARSATLLGDALAAAEMASRALGAARLSEDALAVLDRLRRACLSRTSRLSAIERADREQALSDWLEARELDPAGAGPLSDAGVTPAELDRIAESLDGPALATALGSLEADCTVRSLAAEIEAATSRIHTLVAAIKRFTYMDRQAPELVNVAQGLHDTATILSHKARLKGAQVAVHVADGLPRVRAFGGELNQVWSNLLDNALDAVPPRGHVEIEADQRLGSVIVRIIDNGPGIPPAIREQIFDPFFTTKPVGAGTGLGLDIARRVVRRNDGEIDVESQPGRTQFIVTLPAVQP
jgi:signal transduction histidine kinase